MKKTDKSHTEKYLGESKALKIDAIQVQVKFLQGKVLTILDASFSEREQKKAIKDLVNKAFSEQLTWIMQLCYPETQMMSADQAESTIDDYDKVVSGAVIVEE